VKPVKKYSKKTLILRESVSVMVLLADVGKKLNKNVLYD